MNEIMFKWIVTGEITSDDLSWLDQNASNIFVNNRLGDVFTSSGIIAPDQNIITFNLKNSQSELVMLMKFGEKVSRIFKVEEV